MGNIKFKYCFLPVLALILLSFCESRIQEDTPHQGKFKLVSPEESGIHFANHINDVDEVTLFNNYYAYNGAGVAVGDINNDGLTDVILIGNQVQSQLYLNQGEFTFKDITATSGIDVSSHWATGVNMVDVNSDGFLDIYICRSGPYSDEERQNLLYINNGDLSFTESAKLFGLADQGPSTQAYFFDMDLDGDLDMYLLNHPLEFDDAFNFYFYSDKDSIDPMYSDKLYIQEDGVFKDKSTEMGLEIDRGFGLSASIMDFNGDNYPDIFVANDFLEPDYLWINSGNKLTNQITDYFDKCSFTSMGSSVGDVNNDGLFDLIVVDMAQVCHPEKKMADLPMSIDYYLIQEMTFGIPQFKHNMMYLQDQSGKFHDVSEYAGLSRTDWSWSPLLADYDNDGLEDALITNGLKRNVIDLDHIKNVFKDNAIAAAKLSKDPIAMLEGLPMKLSENIFYKNLGGAKFANINQEWFPNFYSNGQGAALADFNNDGRIDIIINNSDTLAFILKNELDVQSALQLNLLFQEGNINGIGSVVEVFYSGGEQKLIQNYPTKGYYSCSQNAVFITEQNKVDSILVVWPNGKTTSLTQDFKGVSTYTVKYDESNLLEQKYQNTRWIAEPYPIKSNHTAHREKGFPDFKRDKLAYRLHSQEGPCLVVADINQDGLQDFVQCGAYGTQSEICYQLTNGSFSCEPVGEAIDSLYEDIAALVLDLDEDGDLDLYFGSGSREYYKPQDSLLTHDRIYLNQNGVFQLSNTISQLSNPPKFSKTLLAIDLNGDKKIELLSLPRYYVGDINYKLSGTVLSFENGIATDVTSKYLPQLKDLGLVTDAKVGDLDNDGDEDFVVLGEWMSITIFRNENGQFAKEEIPLTVGWWESVELVDIDGDDDLDIVAGNYGENSIFSASPEQPVNLYLEDVNNDGITNPILTHYLCGKEAPFLTRDQLCAAIPSLYNNFPNYASYGNAGMKGVVNTENLQNDVLRAVELRSMYYVNQEDGFKAIPMPAQAQMAPVKAILADDFNGDNCMDIMIAGNSNSEFYESGSILALAPSVLFGDCNGGLAFTSQSLLGFPMRFTSSLNTIKLENTGDKILLISNNNDNLQMYRYPKKLKAIY
jgi:hypothetical protein